MFFKPKLVQMSKLSWLEHIMKETKLLLKELRCIYTSIQGQDSNSIDLIKGILNILRILNIF